MAGLNSTKGADAQSKTTKFAGLPKAIKVSKVSAQAMVNNVFTPVVFDTVAFNYGPFVFEGGAIVVQEAGVYQLYGQGAVDTGAGFFYAAFLVNGTGIGDQVGGQNAGAAAAIAPYWQTGNFVELKAKDSVTFGIFVNSYVPNTKPTAAVWMYVEKRGGQY